VAGIVIAAWLGGIAAVSLAAAIDWPVIGLIAVIGAGFGALFVLSRMRIYLLLGLVAAGAVLGAGETRWFRDAGERTLARLAILENQTITFVGRVDALPDYRETSGHLILRPENLNLRLLVLAPRYPEFRYGDELRVTGRLRRPANFQTERGQIFDYQNYLAKDDIYYEVERAEVTFVQSHRTFRGALYAFRARFITALNRALPEPAAALTGGMTIGAKDLDAPTNELFRTVGLSHIVVLSGYNITVVAGAAFKLLGRWSLFWGQAAGGLLIILFVLATGASSTALRAGLMALIALGGRWLGRENDALRALVVAAILMLIANPRLLVFDLSFQLSFLATLGIILGPPRLEKFFRWLPERFGLRETALTTLSAQLGVYPWLVYKLGQFSLVALPVNLLVLPLVPAVMSFGFLAGLLGFLSNSLAWLIALPNQFLIGLMIIIARLGAAVPLASINFSQVPFFLIAAIYLIYVWQLRKN